MAKNKQNSNVNTEQTQSDIDSVISDLISVLKAKKNLILQGAPGTGKTYIAKKIAKKLIGDDYANSEQFKIVQFHPSYTYEDFVRGIVATVDNEGKMTYSPTNKLMTEFAKIAHENFIDSGKQPIDKHKLNWVREQWSHYKEYLRNTMQSQDEVQIGKSYTLNDVNARNITVGSYTISDNLIVESYIATKINNDSTYSPKYSRRVTTTIVEEFAKYLEQTNIKYNTPDDAPTAEIQRKDYILIIDEINRANLPMVLGELMYALEYRGQNVDTPYDVEGERGVILPHNLYIIGTMNTADRSVGHIDYAIRRRFAFEYIKPRELSNTELNCDNTNETAKKGSKTNNQITWKFEHDLFKKVQSLFDHNTWLSEEFDKRDVAIGHSYFITTKDQENGMTKEWRIKYEIRPLLEEYVKDGILKKENNNTKIEDELNRILK